MPRGKLLRLAGAHFRPCLQGTTEWKAKKEAQVKYLNKRKPDTCTVHSGRTQPKDGAPSLQKRGVLEGRKQELTEERGVKAEAQLAKPGKIVHGVCRM